MNEVLLGIGIVFLLIVGIAVFSRSPRGMDKEAAEEAAKESPEELRRVISKPKPTVEEIIKENKTFMNDALADD